MAPQARDGRVVRLSPEEALRQILRILGRAYSPEEIERVLDAASARIYCGIYRGLCILSTGGEEGGELYSGEAVGIVIGERAYPLPSLLEKLYRSSGRRACVEAKPQGVKAYLYGKDLLATSVEKIHRPFERNTIVGVLDASDGAVIGVGRAMLGPEDLEAPGLDRDRVAAVKNIFDLGWFIRILKPEREEDTA